MNTLVFVEIILRSIMLNALLLMLGLLVQFTFTGEIFVVNLQSWYLIAYFIFWLTVNTVHLVAEIIISIKKKDHYVLDP